MNLVQMYSILPLTGQNLAISAYGLYWHWLRMGRGFDGFVRGYREREYFTLAQWQKWQKERLEQLLPKCSQFVPYYSNNWTKEQKIAASRGELSMLPLLEKKPLRENPRAFLRRDIHPWRTDTFHTSGSTGTPIASIWTTIESRDSLAVREARSTGWAGVSFSDPRATFSGRMVVPDPESTGPFHRFNRVENQVYFSAFHLKPDTARQYVDALIHHKTVWITGYAVSIYLLATFMLEKGIEAPPYLKAIITTSEKLTQPMRGIITKAFGVRVFEEYSTVENALFASECEKGSLHISPDVGIVEILRPDGTHCDTGESGEVVVTNLSRNYQPLIRFRLGDVAVLDERKCSCGREMPVIKEVVGRLEDVVIGSDGRQLVRFHGIFTDQPHIIEGQIVQHDYNDIEVRVVPTSQYQSDDDAEIIKRMVQRLGNDVKITVTKVDEIPRTKAGKFKAVISMIGK